MSQSQQEPSSPTQQIDQETNASLIRTLQMASASQFANKRALRNFGHQIRLSMGAGINGMLGGAANVQRHVVVDEADDDIMEGVERGAGIRLNMLTDVEAELHDMDGNSDDTRRNRARDSIFSRKNYRGGKKLTYNHRLSSYNGFLSAASVPVDSDHASANAHIGTKLYNYMIFNLALSVPLSVILVIFSWNFGRVNERFMLDSRTEFTVDVIIWRHIFSSIALDICFIMCFVLWVDYCVNGLIFFRYISVLIQVLAEKLTGYRASDANAHVREAQNLFLAKFSWKKWLVEALRFSSIIDVYKFHSIGWFAFLLVLFVVRNHLHPHLLPWGFHIVSSVILCIFLSLSFLIGVILQLPFGSMCSSRRRETSRSKFNSILQTIKRLRFLHIFPSVSEDTRDDQDFFPYLPNSPRSTNDHNYDATEGLTVSSPAPVPSISSINQDVSVTSRSRLNHSPSLTFIIDDDHEKESLPSLLLVNIFVFVIYFLIGGGCVLVSLRADQFAFHRVNPWILLSPFIVSIILLILYNLITHLRLSIAYVYQNNRIYIPSACIMIFFFLFLLIQSICILYIIVSYELKVDDVWSTDWIYIFLPLCIFEVLFSVVGVTIVLTAGLRMLWFMWVQARTVSRSEVDEQSLF
mmetsp:Transcript_3622/g.13832  ORF Transcript_3622/g.13832 Transcript_3622/m.13832 type:complete len:636 (+) Transcript_3622:336-2243(+)